MNNCNVSDFTKQLEEMREEYDGDPLRKSDLNPDPIIQFSEWLNFAKKEGIADPNACVLSTVDKNSAPMARAVLLKGLEGENFIFYTNYKSRKARHMDRNPSVVMHFPWFSIERQVVVSGVVEKIESSQSDEYFHSRPLLSRLGALASEQSMPLDSRESLEKSFLSVREKWGDKPERPNHWGGYSLAPTKIEFWQGGPNRLHDRFIYERISPGLWEINRYYP